MPEQSVKPTALLYAVHDPEGRDVSLFAEWGARFTDLYGECFATVSDQTSGEWCEVLAEAGFRVRVIPKGGATHARREVLKFGLEGAQQYFHYCDYDRLLTWALRDYAELRATVEGIPQYDYTILGRTERAFSTHPTEWRETERLTNKVFSLEYGADVDICAGSWAFSRRAAEVILRHTTAPVVDAEWPMIVQRLTPYSVGYRACEGLEYREELNAVRRAVSEAELWLGRLKLTYLIAESAVKTGR